MGFGSWVPSSPSPLFTLCLCMALSEVLHHNGMHSFFCIALEAKQNRIPAHSPSTAAAAATFSHPCFL